MSEFNPHIGSSLDDLLGEDGTLAEAEVVAVKRVLAWQLSKTMSDGNISKASNGAPNEHQQDIAGPAVGPMQHLGHSVDHRKGGHGVGQNPENRNH
ncbi:MAG: hypothetical protein H7829_12050 [Magnetococcus sp. THC-1_WYH]